MDEIYHPIWAAFSNNPTLRNVDARWHDRRGPVRDSHPLRRPRFRGLVPATARPATTDRKTTIQEIRRPPDFKFERCQLHSPLLEISWLVSFPPVINMLKFTGWTRLIRGRRDGPGVRSGVPRRRVSGLRRRYGRRPTRYGNRTVTVRVLPSGGTRPPPRTTTPGAQRVLLSCAPPSSRGRKS